MWAYLRRTFRAQATDQPFELSAAYAAPVCGFMGVPPIPRYQYSPQQINLPRSVLVSCCYTKLVMKILSFWVYTLEKFYGRIFQWFIFKEENCAIWASESMKHNEKRE